MTDKQIITLEGKSIVEYFERIIENKKLKDKLYAKEQRIVDLNKTIQAKEQECEQLKEENFTFEQLIKEYEKYGAIEEVMHQLDKLKAEKEELKNNNNILKEHSRYYKNEGKRYKKEMGRLKAENEQIKKYLGINSKTIMERLEELQEFRDRDKHKLCIVEDKLERIRRIIGDSNIYKEEDFGLNNISKDLIRIIYEEEEWI